MIRRVLLALAAGLGVVWLSKRSNAPLEMLVGILMGAILVVVVAWLTARLSRRNVPHDDGAFLTEHTYVFRADGLHTSRRGATSFLSWSGVKEISVTTEHLFVWVDKFHGFVVPLRDLAAGTGRDEFIRQLESWVGRSVAPDEPWSAAGGLSWAGGPTASAVTATSAAALDDSSRAPRSRWPATLLRLLTLRNAPDPPASASGGLLLLLACLAVGVWVGLNWFDNLPEPELYIYGAPDIAWYGLIALALAVLLAARSVPAVGFPRMLAVVLAAIPIFIVVRYLSGRYLSAPWTMVASLLLLLYCVAYGARSLRALSGRRQPVALVSGVLLTLGLLWLTQSLFVDPSVWMTAEADDASDYESTWKESEPLLFSQSARIDAAVDAIAPAADAAPAVFFVGFAGYAEERVFAEEIELAARVVGNRYGSERRSVFLVNDRRSLENYPLASPTALRYALRRLATKMNTERDILFLALSSHGSLNSLAVSNGPLSLQDLTAADLASALRESGIQWRVIVISACHAGSFIDELRNPDTIVITASAADKTSFGCSDDRDLTYFGEAFYRDALPEAKSLREAFGTAKSEIMAREKRENVSASSPQAFFGAEIERYLQQLP
jgi:hypothetical protein